MPSPEQGTPGPATPGSPEPEAELNAAYLALRKGDLAQAEALCRALLTRSPRNAAALHLFGLIRKQGGHLPDAELLMRESIAIEPGRAEYHANLGNLLRQAGNLPAAEECYREALKRDREHGPARLGLVRTLNDLGRHAAAEAESRVLTAIRGNDPRAWSALAMTLRDQNRFGEAEAAYRQAIAVSPAYGPAHHNLGALLNRTDRPTEALDALAKAQAAGVRGAPLAFTRGAALLQLYRLDEAEAAFAEAVVHEPTNQGAQLSLARLRYMKGDPKFARDLAAAAASARDNAALQMLFADVLRRTGDLAGSEALVRDVIRRKGPLPEIRSALATVLQEAGRLKEAEVEALEAATARPQDPAIIENLVAILLARGSADVAMRFISSQRQRVPDEQRWIAYEATAARLAGMPLYRELYDYGRFTRSFQLEAPPGWASMQELNEALAGTLAARHRFAAHPFDQSLRQGSQTAHNLLVDANPAVQALIKAFEGPIDDYCRAMGTDPKHPLSRRNRGPAAISGAWSVRLQRGGFHVNHVHPEGWISSAYYVAVPDEVQDADNRSGWLKFGETRLPVPGAGPELFVQPRAGLLVLFPSYMWHGTTPILGTEPRLTVAFDAVPRNPAGGRS
jgi:tetratricopeptide (TPR) repeat protein